MHAQVNVPLLSHCVQRLHWSDGVLEIRWSVINHQWSTCSPLWAYKSLGCQWISFYLYYVFLLTRKMYICFSTQTHVGSDNSLCIWNLRGWLATDCFNFLIVIVLFWSSSIRISYVYDATRRYQIIISKLWLCQCNHLKASLHLVVRYPTPSYIQFFCLSGTVCIAIKPLTVCNIWAS